MSTIKEKVIIITGASSGIGEATARLLAQEGAHVVLGARRTDNLKAIANDIIREGGSADYRRLDVTNKEEMNEFVTYVNSRYGQVDVLINNAGVMPLSKLAALKTDEWDQMINVNIRGVLHGIAAGLPIMNKQKFGHFINVSSIGAHEVSPTAAVYCATKFAVRALSEGLRMETGPNIRVTNIAPGVTESELAESISDEEAKQVMKEYRRISLPSNAIAQSILYAIKQPENVDVNEIIVRPIA
ncbi:short-chain dehydrogenase/reductase SDR [Bacillus sp. JCM 19046]|nr:short-chain dehydrogenase/reductase SDR [Bacillus sp. JCM 19045]GAF17165.1 short-chain dehydrogenase/reductase SDR [Bacillus sp. JCM 19046]